MKNKIGYVLTFATGAVVGSVVTYKVIKEKFEQIIAEEIASVKKVYSKKVEETEAEVDKKAHALLVEVEGYLKHSEEPTEQEIKEGGSVVDDIPYVISPDEFGEFDDYETITLTYYADGILADEMDEIVDDMYDILGVDPGEHFGEYEDDSVHVRNDARRVDYEILRDLRNYNDVV